MEVVKLLLQEQSIYIRFLSARGRHHTNVKAAILPLEEKQHQLINQYLSILSFSLRLRMTVAIWMGIIA